MGTRHLIAVSTGNDYPIAQYGQWNGYPEGQGVDVLEFCKKLQDKPFRQRFELGLLHTRDLKDLSDDELKVIEDDRDWQKKWPQLSRDAGADILKHVYEAHSVKEPMLIKRYIEFAADSLFCEWGYVIDLQKNQLEVYKGFNQEPLDKSERFYGMKDEDGNPSYSPIRHLKTYSLDNLPSAKDFVDELNKLARYNED
jgi:hypothetical protein